MPATFKVRVSEEQLSRVRIEIYGDGQETVLESSVFANDSQFDKDMALESLANNLSRRLLKSYLPKDTAPIETSQ